MNNYIKYVTENPKEALNDSIRKKVARDEYLKILTKQKIKLELELGVSKDVEMVHLYNQVNMLKNEKAKESDTRYLGFFTFNFKPEITLEKLFIFMGKLTKKNWLSDYSYCIEQRGETLEEIGKGLHVHLLFKRNQKRPSECVRECYNTFNKYTGMSYNIFNTKSCKFYPLDYYEEKIEYMTGKKWDTDKLSKVEMDKKFREKNNIKLLYTN